MIYLASPDIRKDTLNQTTRKCLGKLGCLAIFLDLWIKDLALRLEERKVKSVGGISARELFS